MQSQASPRVTILVFVIVALMIVGGGILLLSSRPEPVEITIHPPVPTATPEPTVTPGPITVYVTGAVEEPETLVTLPHNSRVNDALEAVGGVTDEADMSRVNLAGIVRDGDQIHVPSITSESADNPLPTRSGGDLVYINSATLEELQELPGLGPTLAERIIEYREANGPFFSLDDLNEVSGIGPALLEEIADLISFD